MISRVAEHCFWMSRYLERAENTARILEVNQSLLLDFDVPVEQQWKPLLIISGIHDMPGEADAETVQNYLTWEMSNLSSIAACVAAARENARVIREVISSEMWERLNFYHLWLVGPGTHSLYDYNRNEFYNQVRRVNQLFHGITDGTMSHGEAWEFLQLGKFLERASQTARILDVKYHLLLPTPQHLGTSIDNAHWMAILNSCSAYEPYHKQPFLGEPEVSVPEFLIYDSLFPRSVRHSLLQCQKAAHAISGRPLSQPGNDVELALQALVGWLYLVQIDDFLRAGLHDGLTSVIDRIHEIGNAIQQTYFDVRPPKFAGAATLHRPPVSRAEEAEDRNVESVSNS
jgi:uncharacterized alpha-E superfamily protein